jgi:Amt family ammonium transporter
LKAQFIGSFTITLAVFVVAFVMMFIINKLGHPWKLRIEEEGEAGAGGIDVFDHGIEVYPAQDDEISLSGLFDKGVKSPSAV